MFEVCFCLVRRRTRVKRLLFEKELDYLVIFDLYRRGKFAPCALSIASVERSSQVLEPVLELVCQ